MTLKEAYHYGLYFLEANGVDEAEFKTLCIICHLDGIKNNEFEVHKDDEIVMKRFADLLWRVKSGEPLQYVIGKWDFYDSEFYVGEGVLIPRPETEELTDLAVKIAKAMKSPVIYDLCAGSGCIGISIAKAVPKANVILIEKSRQAMLYLIKNKENVANAKAYLGDINDFKYELETADLIISNPPYIRADEISTLQAEVQYEPEQALNGGCDGLDFYRIINDKWTPKLKQGGRLLLEIGNEQADDVAKILSKSYSLQLIKDIYGNDRIISAIKS